jgi:hypothetical protein
MLFGRKERVPKAGEVIIEPHYLSTPLWAGKIIIWASC